MVAPVRVKNTRYPGAPMAGVQYRFDPVTLEPNPLLLQFEPIMWNDVRDCRPWAELFADLDAGLEAL